MIIIFVLIEERGLFLFERLAGYSELFGSPVPREFRLVRLAEASYFELSEAFFG